MFQWRSYFSFFLVVIFSAGLIYQTAEVVHFYLNQKEITEKYCENKAQPEKKCHGKCHLNKQLNIAEGNKQNPSSEPVQSLSFWLYGVELINSFKFELINLDEIQNTFYQDENLTDEFTSRFVPPDIC
ncbi:MAG: hypothetical protein IPM77_12380 [Crocinitomicaceae bacterium]|nr:hypothetical protein [Crocinitomicaceae bacterium]